MLIGQKMPVGVHRERDSAVPHDRLDDVRMNALQGQPRAAGMPQSVEVESFTSVIGHGQEIALLAFGQEFGGVLHFAQPMLSGQGQVAAKHVGNRPFIGHGKHVGRGGFRGHKVAQFFSEVRLDVLPCFLPVLGVLCAAADEGLVAGQEQIGLGE
ncbi:MAG TPA: hypothetical protein VGZ47_13200 [Gemmataceae bacterium]|nr:hypothetical protein [Gemmataceae bacterium]